MKSFPFKIMFVTLKTKTAIMINVKYFLLLIFTGLTLFVSAQKDKNLNDGRMLLSIGAGNMNMSELNEALEPNGYPSLESNGWDWGISIWFTEKRLHFIYDVSAHSRKSGTGTTSNYDAGDFAINLGYSLVKREHLSLVPYLGLGMEYGRLELILKEDPAVNTVSGYIADASRSQNMDMWGLIGSMGFYALWDFSSKSENPNFTLGLHGGYSPRLITQQWRSAGGEKLQGMNIPGGFNVNLVLGVAF